MPKCVDPQPVRISQASADELERFGQEREARAAELADARALRTRIEAQAVAAGLPTVDPLVTAWIGHIKTTLGGSEGAFLTGTYSDTYGYPNGLMAAHNVVKDFERFRRSSGLDSIPGYVFIERHKYRDILHCHSVLGGKFSKEDCYNISRAWSKMRGWGDCGPLQDGGVEYCAKYGLKSQDSAAFEWWLP